VAGVSIGELNLIAPVLTIFVLAAEKLAFVELLQKE
jgi:hypothetical protein